MTAPSYKAQLLQAPVYMQYMLSKRKQKQKRTDKHTNTLTVPSYKAQLLQAGACKSWALYDGTVNVFVCLSVRFCFCFCFRLLSIYCDIAAVNSLSSCYAYFIFCHTIEYYL